MEITKESLEWIISQIEHIEEEAPSLENEAYHCRLESQRWVKDGKVTFKSTSVPEDTQSL